MPQQVVRRDANIRRPAAELHTGISFLPSDMVVYGASRVCGVTKKRHCHIVYIGSGGACDDKSAYSFQRVVGIVILQYAEQDRQRERPRVSA